MNLRKLLALLIAAIMLLGIVPVGHAEGGNMMPGGEFTVSCNHNWAWRWPNGKPANCQDWRISEEYCTKCGTVNSSFEQCGDCQPGSWHWDGNPPANCNEWGIQNQSCSICGEVFNEREARGDHKWGEWEIEYEATCTEKGMLEHRCSVCGKHEYRYTDPIDHVLGDWRVIEEPQVGIPGTERRACIYGCGTHEDREIPPLEQDFGSDELVSTAGLSLTLSLSSTPANGTHFVVGEEVIFTETWSNGTGKTLYPFSVSIWTCGTPVFGSEIDQICSWFAEDAGGPVAPGATGSHTLTVTVTEADVTRGAIYAMAELLSTVHNGVDLENVTAPFVTAPCGPDNSGDFGLVNGLTVTKKVTSTPANGSYYVPGETVTYEVCVKNNGEPLNMLCVSDWMRDGTFKYGTIETGEDVTYPISYTVIELDAISGSVSNISFAEAVAANGDPVLEYSNSVTVPCGFPEGDDPFGIFHSLAVIKKEESLPLNGQFYTEGEVIHYSITYTNDGELPLTDVEIWDVLDVTKPVASAEMLHPGESRVCYYQHTVTAEDVAAGSVMNVAHASYPVSNAAGFANSTSNVVISKASAYHWVWVTPLFPEDATPEYDPGTGWFPPEEESETPGFGTIDTDALHGGDTYCVRTITGRDNVSVSYDTTFCSVHSPIQSSMLLMTQAAVTPEMQAQTAAYAVALWRAEVQKLYQEIYKASDPTAKMVVMTEYIRFLTDVANYEAMLKVQYPDQPALAAMKVAAMWENKCIDLCYDAHTAAAERKDSLLAVTPAIGAAAGNCTCEVVAQEAGKKTGKQSYCLMHSFPFSMTDTLLQGNDTAESWTMVRQIWGVELTSAYNKLYTAMGDNKLLAMAEYNALTQWMMAREAFLIALYPDNPEIVVQLMVKTIMERVNALCQAVN